MRGLIGDRLGLWPPGRRVDSAPVELWFPDDSDPEELTPPMSSLGRTWRAQMSTEWFGEVREVGPRIAIGIDLIRIVRHCKDFGVSACVAGDGTTNTLRVKASNGEWMWMLHRAVWRDPERAARHGMRDPAFLGVWPD